MEEPDAGKLLVRVCGGAGRQRTALPGTFKCPIWNKYANFWKTIPNDYDADWNAMPIVAILYFLKSSK
jgi:hypothetical protein